MEDRRAPGALFGPAPAYPDLARLRHDRLQWRIGQEGVGQLAWRRRVRAGELHRGGRAQSLAVSRVRGEGGREGVGRAERRIEPREAMAPRELGRGARAVLDLDAGHFL